VQEGLLELANTLGGQSRFRELIISYVQVAKVASACGRGCTKHNGDLLEFYDSGSPPTTVDISNTNTIDKWTVVHEFGHVLDGKNFWSLSRGLMRFTDGTRGAPPISCDGEQRLPGCNRAGYYYGGIPPAGSDANFNEKEDFAESIAASVYPTTAQSRIQRFQNDPTYSPYLYYSNFYLTERWEYVKSLR
jgi:hypothetical protein